MDLLISETIGVELPYCQILFLIEASRSFEGTHRKKWVYFMVP